MVSLINLSNSASNIASKTDCMAKTFVYSANALCTPQTPDDRIDHCCSRPEFSKHPWCFVFGIFSAVAFDFDQVERIVLAINALTDINLDNEVGDLPPCTDNITKAIDVGRQIALLILCRQPTMWMRCVPWKAATDDLAFAKPTVTTKSSRKVTHQIRHRSLSNLLGEMGRIHSSDVVEHGNLSGFRST